MGRMPTRGVLRSIGVAFKPALGDDHEQSRRVAGPDVPGEPPGGIGTDREAINFDSEGPGHDGMARFVVRHQLTKLPPHSNCLDWSQVCNYSRVITAMSNSRADYFLPVVQLPVTSQQDSLATRPEQPYRQPQGWHHADYSYPPQVA